MTGEVEVIKIPQEPCVWCGRQPCKQTITAVCCIPTILSIHPGRQQPEMGRWERVVRPTTEMMCGAPPTKQLAAAEIQAIADKVKSPLEEKENKKFLVFNAVEFKSQGVAGRTFFTKVQMDDDFVHIQVFESLPQENKPVALTSYQIHKGRQDEVTCF
uniref:Cystatin domain-containing protein n=1 Tax=Bos taurus TaxID=9913 RepID=A0AAA9SLA6_BOVIN